MASENKKLESILNAARTLFWKYGLKRVSIEEICTEAGVSKMTFYKHFCNKTDLAKRLLNAYFTDAMQEYRRIMDSDKPWNIRVREAIVFKLEGTRGISYELVNEMYKSGDPEILAFIQEWSNRSMSMMMDDFRSWQANGDVRNDLKPEFMLYMLGKMGEIATDEGLRQLYQNPEALVHEMINFLFYGLMPLPKD